VLSAALVLEPSGHAIGRRSELLRVDLLTGLRELLEDLGEGTSPDWRSASARISATLA
jgi:hypothetical protein